MKDTIYREDAIKAFDTKPFVVGDAETAINIYSYICDVMRRLKNLPSAQPERIRGKWIHDGYDIPHGVDWMHCSVCGRREPHVPAAMTNFCPDCGADMREGGEDERQKDDISG